MQNAPKEHSAILSTFIKLPGVLKTIVLSIFEWPLKTGFTFIILPDYKVNVPGYGDLVVDICFGGAYFAILDASQVNLDVRKSSIRELTIAADAITSK